MTLILCAIKLEAKPFLEALENKKTEKRAKLKIYHGMIDGSTVAVARCGVGLEKAAAAVRSLIDDLGASLIIMSGTAGGIDKKLKIGDTVVSEELVYHEPIENIPMQEDSSGDNISFKADANLLSSAIQAVEKVSSAHTVYFGRITSGNKFVRGKNFDTITEKFDPLCSDMESAAAAHVCFIKNTPFIAVRSISDSREDSGIFSFFKHASQASKNSCIVVRKLLSELK